MSQFSSLSDASNARLPTSPSEQTAFIEMMRFGSAFGAAYLNIWDGDGVIRQAAYRQVAFRAHQVVPNTVKPDAEARMWFWCAWADGGLVVMLSSFLIAGFSGGKARGLPEVFVVLLLIAAGCVWFLFIKKWRGVFAKQRDNREKWLRQVGMTAARTAIEDRRQAARL